MATGGSILDEAKKIVHGARQKGYGGPKESFGRIAAMWSAYLGTEVTDQDVAMMMVLLKVSRARNGISKDGVPQEDSLVDIAGYAACAELIYRS